MKLYRFDGVDAELTLIPLAARRVLDGLGRKLSLEAFVNLPLESRQALTRAGSGGRIDKALGRRSLEGAQPAPTPIEPRPEPETDRVPAEVLVALGSERPLPLKVWQQLSALDRYSLIKTCESKKPERLTAAYKEIVGDSAVSTHVRPEGGVHMVSIAHKEPTQRMASAETWVSLSPEAFARLVSSDGPKGDVLSTARLAGLMATKRTSDLIPLCHPLAIDHAQVDLLPEAETHRVRVVCTVVVFARTGVEMEAMVGANVAALTIYDMLKSLDRGMRIGPCQLLHKSGGRSGTYDRKES